MLRRQIVIIFVLYNSQVGSSLPLNLFYPFGSTEGDISMEVIDDGSTSSIPLPVQFPFFGSNYSSIFVSNYTFFKSIMNKFCRNVDINRNVNKNFQNNLCKPIFKSN